MFTSYALYLHTCIKFWIVSQTLHCRNTWPCQINEDQQTSLSNQLCHFFQRLNTRPGTITLRWYKKNIRVWHRNKQTLSFYCTKGHPFYAIANVFQISNCRVTGYKKVINIRLKFIYNFHTNLVFLKYTNSTFFCPNIEQYCFVTN